MELTENSLTEAANLALWLNRIGIASDLVLAIVCTGFLCLNAYFVLSRRELALPAAAWTLAVYLACSVLRYIVMIVFDQSMQGWTAITEMLVAISSLALFVLMLRLTPALRGLAVISKQNLDLEREVKQRSLTETTLQQRVSELERINAELEYVSRGVVGREERILELKREINHLLERVGEQPRYRAAMELNV
jgi:hypothetical protein